MYKFILMFSAIDKLSAIFANLAMPKIIKGTNKLK